jgi:cell division protein FtsN
MPPVVLPQPAPPPPVPQFSGVMEVVPGVPDPNTNKIYHLQVGSFSMPEAAARTIQILKNAGLNAAYEVHGQWYRVLVMGIPAPETYSTIQKLGLLGIRQVWVRE